MPPSETNIPPNYMAPLKKTCKVDHQNKRKKHVKKNPSKKLKTQKSQRKYFSTMSLLPPSCDVGASHPQGLLTSDASGQNWNTCLWDAASGAVLSTYKGSTSKARTHTFLGDAFMVSAQQSKPLLNVWQVNRHEQQSVKYTTPGNVNAVAASPGGKYLAASVKEEIYLWNVSSGRLLRCLQGGHYQDVTNLSFTDDGAHLVSSGQDGCVSVWPLLEAVCRRAIPGQAKDEVDQPAPRHKWTEHALAVTDMLVTQGGLRSKIVSVSADKTCKVFCLAAGKMLLDIVVGERLGSVAVDATEETLFCGADSGSIYAFPMISPPRTMQVIRSEDNSRLFEGHKAAVTCLSVSLDGATLASGSDDCTVKLWNKVSRQCVRTLDHKGKLTSVRFILPFKGMLKPEEYKQSLHFPQLQKAMKDDDKDFEVNFYVRQREEVENEEPEGVVVGVKRSSGESQGDSEQVKKLMKVNLELYRKAKNEILEK